MVMLDVGYSKLYPQSLGSIERTSLVEAEDSCLNYIRNYKLFPNIFPPGEPVSRLGTS